MLAQTITVSNEKEIYDALQLKECTIYFQPGVYNMGKYIKDMKRTMKLSNRKNKSQLKR